MNWHHSLCLYLTKLVCVNLKNPHFAVYLMYLTYEILHLVDGGYLLQHFIWSSLSKVSDILQGYGSYVHRHFVKNSIIAFDGYDTPGTKGRERL